jgi:hypothetical protein
MRIFSQHYPEESKKEIHSPRFRKFRLLGQAPRGSKRLELLHEVVPTASTIAALVNPNNPLAESESSVLKAAAHTLGLPIHILHASTDDELDTVFATLVQLRLGVTSTAAVWTIA